MIQKKSNTEDIEALLNVEARPGLRASAIANISSDRLYQYEPQIAQCLSNSSSTLRGQAIMCLVGRWHLDTYLNKALIMLDTDPETQSIVLLALSFYYASTRQNKEEILKAIGRCYVQADEDTQRDCYKCFLNIINPDNYQVDLEEDYDLRDDPNWDEFKKYLPVSFK